ncbi:Uncharacterized protein OBRU01_23876 [Operophtera brumata]|uniref:Uncharacterized protein n=1 Tax=Operophtera brumata TaxID=104452 RepID=A0A0L7KNM5_OPEBR|nr:Uncharacterized protein OBRU01_23876 [Operophtera brumata]
MVMGSVAFIEERQKFNMGLGIPAGGISVLAAATSAAGAGAGAAGVLWVAATCLLIALVVQSCRTILDPPGLEHSDGPTEEDSRPSSRDLVVIACVQIALAVATLLSAAICARIDYST